MTDEKIDSLNKMAMSSPDGSKAITTTSHNGANGQSHIRSLARDHCSLTLPS
jgi:hypothetical protein